MRYLKIFSAFVLSSILMLSSGFVSIAQDLSEEQVQNYKSMGMTDDDLQKIREELKHQENPNYVTKTEQDFYINKMGIREEDMNQMIKEQEMIGDGKHEYDDIQLFRIHGSYPKEKGIILVTKDKLAGIVPLGHAAIVYNEASVVEANPGEGVHVGKNNWNKTRITVYGLKVHKISAADRAKVADWCMRKKTLPYNPNFYDVNTRKRFYCSQLVWAGFKDIFNIDLNGGQYGQAIYPPEMIDSGYVYRIYIKGDGY